MQHKTLILSIALNGYQWMYHRELNSHKEYANRNGYVYQAVTRPVISVLGVECCWLKLTLMRKALMSGYDNVLFLDADTMVSPHCPPLARVYKQGKYVYMAKGYSNRFNSGVLIANSNPESIAWLTRVINSRRDKVHKDNDIGWGENGHIIELSKGIPFIEELEQKWNNTFDYNLKDYIRHSNCGPMRTNYLHNFFHKVVFYLSAKMITIINRYHSFTGIKNDKNELGCETNKILSLYPKLIHS